MGLTLRIIFVVLSILSFALCIKRIKQSRLKITNSVLWILGSFVLILMAIFSEAVSWIATQLGFMATVNFVFFVLIGLLLIQAFVDNIRICTLNEKIKDLNHYIAIQDYENKK